MPRILFADDNKEIRGIISSMLDKLGYDVVTADDGAEAIKKFNESSFDVVVTDLMMPGTNGYDLAKHIRKKANGAIPTVIGITGTAWDVDLSFFDIVLEKPFSIKKLIKCINDLENKQELS